ncbi:MAG: DUF1064 domain-containing protein [Bacilli bacterium]
MRVSKQIYEQLINHSINSKLQKQNKYKNKHVEYHGIKFDSKKEGTYYLKLKAMEELGIIKDLKLQVKFELQPSFKFNGKTIRAINYIAGFTYYDENNKYHIVDTKGVKTEIYKIKKKMMQYKGYEIGGIAC